MSLGKYFSEAVRKIIPQSVNEAAGDDTARNRLTTQNALANIFGLGLNGLRIPSAMKPGAKPPDWDSRYLTYPFVGMNGCALTPAKSAKKGNERSFVRGSLQRMAFSNADIEAEFEKRGDAVIPPTVALFYGKTGIENAGTANLKNSMTPFNPRNVKDVYFQSIAPFHLQQVMGLGSDGSLFVDKTGRVGKVVMNTQYDANGLRYVDHVTNRDLFSVGHGDDAEFVKQYVVGSNPNACGSILGNFVTSLFVAHQPLEQICANPLREDLRNPTYKRFDLFLKENDFRSFVAANKVDTTNVAAINAAIAQFMREWIDKAAGTERIVDGLFRKYLLLSDFDRTYVLRRIPEGKMSTEKFIYRKMFGRNGELNVGGEEDGQKTGGSKLSSAEFDEEIGESSDGGIKRLGGETMAQKLIDICERFAKSPLHKNPTATFVTDSFYSNFDALRGGGDEKVRSSGEKISFVRIVGSDADAIASDGRILAYSRELSNRESGWGTLDFTPVFAAFPDMFEESAQKTFDVVTVNGYLISFDYDEGMEKIALKAGGGKLRAKALLNAYDTYGKQVDKPMVFFLTYVKTDEGNFIFSGYDANAVKRGSEANVPELIRNADFLPGKIGSKVFNDFNDVILPSAYNRNYH